MTKRQRPDHQSSYLVYLEQLSQTRRPYEFNDWSDLIGTEVGSNKKYINTLPMTLFKSINLRFKYTSTGLNTWDLMDQNGVQFNILQVNNMNALSLTNNTKAAAWNSWQQFYDRYITKWVKIEVTYINNSDSPIYVGIAFRPIAEIGGATWDNLRFSVNNTFPNKQAFLTAKGGCKDTVTLSVTCDLASLWGLKSQYTDSTTFSSTTFGTPNTIQQAVVYALYNQNNSAPAPAIVNYSLKLEFLTTMYQNKLLLGV